MGRGRSVLSGPGFCRVTIIISIAQSAQQHAQRRKSANGKSDGSGQCEEEERSESGDRPKMTLLRRGETCTLGARAESSCGGHRGACTALPSTSKRPWPCHHHRACVCQRKRVRVTRMVRALHARRTCQRATQVSRASVPPRCHVPACHPGVTCQRATQVSRGDGGLPSIPPSPLPLMVPSPHVTRT